MTEGAQSGKHPRVEDDLEHHRDEAERAHATSRGDVTKREHALLEHHLGRRIGEHRKEYKWQIRHGPTTPCQIACKYFVISTGIELPLSLLSII